MLCGYSRTRKGHRLVKLEPSGLVEIGGFVQNYQYLAMNFSLGVLKEKKIVQCVSVLYDWFIDMSIQYPIQCY